MHFGTKVLAEPPSSMKIDSPNMDIPGNIANDLSFLWNEDIEARRQRFIVMTPVS